MRTVFIERGFEDWRRQSRQLLQAGIAPHELTWTNGQAGSDLFAAAAGDDGGTPGPPRPTRVPRELPALLECASRFRAGDRWALLYRVLWRVAHGDRSAMLAGDRDGGELQRRIRQVRREAHHMEAFVRFRERPQTEGAPRFVAWHEPAHDVLELVTEHFLARLGRVGWLIATPDAAAQSNGVEARLLRPCPPELAAMARSTADDTDELWRAYYSSTFNPARVNAGLARQHMPARFWKHLPEGVLIARLAANARLSRPHRSQAAAVAEKVGQQVQVCTEQARPKRPLPSSLETCRNCALWRDATCAVPGEGPKTAGLMLVGEQPGDQEDLAGRPFIGPAGRLLDRQLADAGLRRAEVYVTNAVKHFKWQAGGGLPPLRRHRTPDAEEIAACRPWLEQELAQVRPRVVVALGRTALAALLQASDPTRLRLADFLGRPRWHNGRWVVAAPHPAAILRSEGTLRERLIGELQTALRQAATLQAD